MRILDSILFMFFLFFMVLGDNVRHVYGETAFQLFFLFSLLYLWATDFRNLRMPLLLLGMWGSVYVVFSYYDYFSPQWTTFFDSTKIPRQAFYVLFLPVLVATLTTWLKRVKPEQLKQYLTIIIVGAAGIFLLLEIMVFSPNFRSIIGHGGVFQSLKNNILVFYAALFLLSTTWSVKSRLIVFASLSVLAFFYGSNGQSFLALGLLFIWILIGKFPHWLQRLGLVTFAFSLPIIYLITIPLVGWVYQMDPNAGVRILFFSDSFAGLLDGAVLGVGFGTESVRLSYHVGVPIEFVDYRGPFDYMMIGPHNSFANIFFRLGLPGLIFFITFVYSIFPRELNHRSYAPGYGVFTLLYLCLWVNNALLSPTYILGVGFCCSILLARPVLVRHKKMSNKKVPINGKVLLT